MEERELVRTLGPAATAGLFALTFPQLPPEVGVPLIGIAVAITVWGYWPTLAARLPWLRRMQPQPINMQEMLRRVAFDSRWAKIYNMQTEREHALRHDWQAALKWYACGPLKAGRVKATGLRYDKDGLAIGREEIPPEFWGEAEFSPLLVLYEEDADFAGAGTGDSYVQYTQIRFDRADTSREWPIGKKGDSPFLEPANEARAEQEQAVAEEQARWIQENRHLYLARRASPPTLISNAKYSEAFKMEAREHEQDE